MVAVVLSACGGSGTTERTERPERTARPVVVDTSVQVTYKLDGTATGADVTYTDGSGNIQQQNGLKVPVVRKSDGGEGLRMVAHSGDFVQFSAQNTGERGDLTCTIEADGVVINTGHASGGYAIVSCSATLP